MKRLSWLLVIPVLFGIGLFTSCEDTSTEDKITITAGSANADTVEVGVQSTFTFSIIADAKLASIEVLRDNKAVEGTLKEDGFTNNTSDNYSFSFTAEEADAGTSIDFSLMVVDKNEKEKYEDFTVHVKDLAPTISSYTAVIMGADDNKDYGSFLGTSDGTVYKVGDVTNNATNQSKVDIVYYYGTQNAATLSAPDDAGAAEFVVYALNNWTNKNQTRFTSKLTTDFSAVESADDIAAVVSSPTATKANVLAIGDVVGFQTQAGKKGLAKVTAITTGRTGTITLEVKVQL